MSYEGVGTYQHYKGGKYTALGVGEVEHNGKKMVVYHSHDGDHEDERADRGVDFVLRPLTDEDGPDAWNSQPICPYCDHGIAGGKPCEFKHCAEGLISVDRFTKTAD